MKRLRHLALCMASSLIAHGTATAESPTVAADDGHNPSSPDGIRVELKQMLIADAAKIAPASPDTTKGVVANPSSAGAITMSPYIVREARPPDINQPASQIPLFRWLKDGTLYDRVGDTFTVSAKLTFYQTPSPAAGNIKPVSGAKVGFSWSW